MKFKRLYNQLQLVKNYNSDFHGFFQKPVKVRSGYVKAIENTLKNPNFSNFKISLFKRSLFLRQQVKIFYGGLKEYQFKNFLKKSPQKIFINFEKRLDWILYRLGFFGSIRFIRKIVKLGYITVNGFCIKNFAYQLKKNDIVSCISEGGILFFESWLKKVKFNNNPENSLLERTFFRFFPLQYIEFSPSTGNFLLYNEPYLIHLFFPFSVSVSSLLNAYSHVHLKKNG